MNASQATNAATSSPELAALMAQVTALSKLSLKVARLCITINDALPDVVAAEVAAALAATSQSSGAFVRGVAVTPDELDRAHPHGDGDYQSWYVVITGREPGIYRSASEADAQVLGVPGQFRQKKTSRREALDFYRAKYNDNQVAKLNELS